MDKSATIRPSEDFLKNVGIEDKLNEILDSQQIKEIILPSFETTKAKISELVSKVPEKFKSKATELAEDIHFSDQDTFIELVLGKVSEELEDSLWGLSHYLPINADEIIAELTADDSSKLKEQVKFLSECLIEATVNTFVEKVLSDIADCVESPDEFTEVIKLLLDVSKKVPVIVVISSDDSEESDDEGNDEHEDDDYDDYGDDEHEDDDDDEGCIND